MTSRKSREIAPKAAAELHHLNYLMNWRPAAAIANRNNYTASAVEDPSSQLHSLLHELIWAEVGEISTPEITEAEKCLSALDQYSKAFGQLVRILNDCIDRGQLRRGYELALDFYHYACLLQLHVAYSNKDNPRMGLEKSRIHKGHMLFELHRMAKLLNWSWHASYYLALAFLEDVFTFLCTMPGKETVFGPAVGESVATDSVMDDDFARSEMFRRFWAATGSCENYRIRLGVTEMQVHHMVKKVIAAVFEDVPADIDPHSRFVFAKRLSNGAGWNPLALLFPEWTYGRVSIEAAPWLDAPSSEESSHGAVNKMYWAFLCRDIQDLEAIRGKSTTTAQQQGLLSNALGVVFEELSRYACETVPGVRVQMRAKGKGGEIDMIGFIGSKSIFLYDTLGPYFCGECKWKNKPMSVDEIEKVGSRAKRTDCKSFLCFTQKGVAGAGNGKDAEAVIEALRCEKVVGVVIDGTDLQFKRSIDCLDKDLQKEPRAIELRKLREYPAVQFAIMWQRKYENQRLALYKGRQLSTPEDDES